MGAVLVSVFAFIFAYVVFMILKAVMGGVRVSEEEEERGLDISEHGPRGIRILIPLTLTIIKKNYYEIN